MLKKKIFIIDLPILYKILREVKHVLNFDLILSDNLNIIMKFTHNQLENKSDLFVISRDFKKKIKIKFSNKNFFVLEDEPLTLKDFLTKINICFLKLNYSNKSKIIYNDYQLDLNSKVIKKENLFLKLTEREINLILYLFNSKKSLSVEDLEHNIWKQKKNLETYTVETHVHRLRKKFKNTFNNQIILSDKDGYFIKY